MQRSPLPFRVIPCDEWGASKPNGAIQRVGRPGGSVFHHTAGHVPNLSAGETYAEACAYARAIQKQHMGQGWVDSGHNFLITRGGFILEGRHGSLISLKAGQMVRSAHCPHSNPNTNEWPGVEHEHDGSEAMTPIEKQASVWLHARICTWAGIKPSDPDLMAPHKRYFATACPGSLTRSIAAIRKGVVEELSADDEPEAWYAKYGPAKKPAWFFPLLREAQRRYS
jgi:hypothetical protein